MGTKGVFKSAEGMSPLHLLMIKQCCPKGTIKILERLGPVDYNAKDNYGLTPLYHAVQNYSSPEVIKFLLDQGADITMCDFSGVDFQDEIKKLLQ